MKKNFVGLMFGAVLGLLICVLSYGESNVVSNVVKSTNDLITNDIHITKIDQQSVTLVYELPITKKQIYDKIIAWMAINYNDSKSVIKVKDIEAGQIIGKGVVEYPMLWVKFNAEFTIIIDIKDNKFRIQYNNYICIGNEQQTIPVRRSFTDNERGDIYNIQKQFILQSRSIYNYVLSNQNNSDF